MKREKILYKKAKFALISVLLVSLISGCGASGDSKGNGKGGNDNNKNNNNDNDVVQEQDSGSDGFKVKVDEDIQKSIDTANKMTTSMIVDDEGNIFYTNYTDACAYYGKDIKIVAEIDDGYVMVGCTDKKIYHYEKLVSDKYDVKDIINTDVGVVIITEDGEVLFYDDKYDLYQNYRYPYGNVNECQNIKDIVAGFGGYLETTPVFDKDANRFNVKSDDGNNRKDKPLLEYDVSGWKNLAVVDGVKSSNNKVTSMVGIAGDGTVYAAGDYSEDVLSWGELKYVSVGSNGIVGVTRDGSLKIAGKYADEIIEKFKKYEIKNVEAAIINGATVLVKNDEGYYCADVFGTDEALFFNKSEADEYCRYDMLTKDGKFYSYDKDKKAWVEEEQNFNGSNYGDVVIGSDLSSGNIEWGTNLKGLAYVNYDACDVSFMLVDINGDGMKEVFLKNDDAIHAQGYMAFASVLKGNLSVILSADEITGYYQDCGIIKTGRTNKGYYQMSYWQYRDGMIIPLVYSYRNDNSTTGETKYYKYEDNSASEDALDDGLEYTNVEITQEEFDKFINDNVKGEFTSLNTNEFVDNKKGKLEKELFGN